MGLELEEGQVKVARVAVLVWVQVRVPVWVYRSGYIGLDTGLGTGLSTRLDTGTDLCTGLSIGGRDISGRDVWHRW